MNLRLRYLTLTLFALILTSITAFSQTATISTDLPDYPPGATVIITGSGWHPGEIVTLQVVHLDNGDNSRPVHQPFITIADDNGNVNSSWSIPQDEDELGATLKLTADGGTSGLHAEMTFTDAINFSNESLSSQLNSTSYGSSVTADFTYTFKVTGAGSGTITYNINCTGLPAGVSYSPASTSISGNGTFSVTLKLTTGAATPGSLFTVTVSAGTIIGTAKTSTLVINKANPSVNATGGTFSYNGSPHTCNGSAIGVLSESLSPVILSYAGTGATSYGPTTTAPTNAGTYTVTASFAGNTNYNSGSSSPVALTINKANASINVTGYNEVYDGNVHTASGTATGVGGVDLSSGLSFASSYTNVPGGSTTWSFSGGTNYNDDNGTTTVTISAATLDIYADNKSRQYSDPNPVFTGTYTGAKNGEVFILGYTITATVTSAPGTNIITPSVSGATLANYTVVKHNGTLTVTKEDGCGSYNGTLFANTGSPTGGSTTIRLSVVVTESPDGNLGDVRNANVSFTVSGDFTAGTYSATLDPSSTSTLATFYKDITVTLSSSQLSKTGEVSWAINGYYTDDICSDRNTEVTVSAPSPDFITGGGYIVLDNSAYGKYKGDAGSKNNFGFSVKWNKSFSNIQGGGINSIIRKGNHSYQIKGNKVTALSVTPANGSTPATASFTCNAIVNDIVNNVVVSTEGNCIAIIEISDVCEPGSGAKTSSDLIAITVKDKNGVVIYSNKWDPTTKKTLKQALNGGNIQIHTDSKSTNAPLCINNASLRSSSPVSMSVEPQDLPFNVTIGPNPSALGSDFTLVSQGNNNESIRIRVVDMAGKVIFQTTGSAGQTYRFGAKFTSGMYIVQVSNDKVIKNFKVVKQ